MRGVVFTGDRNLELRTFPDPAPGPGEVVIELKASGMCGSDLKVYRHSKSAGGDLAFGFADPGEIIAGHEPCGIVAAVGADVTEKQARIGARVMQFHYAGCGFCAQCRSGWGQLCLEGVKTIFGVTGNGAHAKYLKCPANTLVHLPDELSFETGAAISCGTGTAWAALHRLGLGGQHTIAIFGQGPVGLSATQLAVTLGARVIAIDVGRERLEAARKFGADATVNPSQTDDVVGAIRELTHGPGADVSLDASSSPVARAQAVRCVRTWGKACFVGEGGDVTLDVSPDLLRRQVTLIGSWTFSITGQAECARFIADRNIDVDALFTDRWRLADAEHAYEVFDTQTKGKGVFVDFA
ncbi:MAG TPA: zinc-binding dehydrogenase [Candidatus Baltobacteraceae bacterium]|jgi:threonine dehydrogenase-like Zn-dependent dehydrogenase